LQEEDFLAELLTEVAGKGAAAEARKLVEKFGSLVGVLRQAAAETAFVEFDAPLTVRLREVAMLFDHSLRRDAAISIRLGDLQGVMLYLKAGMAPLPVEVFRVLFLDGDNRLIEDRTMWAGTVDRVQVHIREVVRQALELDAIALLIAHNHTSAPPTPSAYDRALTMRLLSACNAFDLRINDHLIVGRSGCYSMRASGLLEVLEQEVSQSHSQSDRAA
jgi:DNA repair protein RadC